MVFPLSFTPENIITVVVALLVLLGSWLTSRTRKRGDAESNVMNRLETLLKRADERLEQAESDLAKANRNIAILQRHSISMYSWVSERLPDASGIPSVPELEA